MLNTSQSCSSVISFNRGLELGRHLFLLGCCSLLLCCCLLLSWFFSRLFTTNKFPYHFINSTSWIYTIIEHAKYEIIDQVSEINEKDQLIIIDSQLSIKKELYEK